MAQAGKEKTSDHLQKTGEQVRSMAEALQQTIGMGVLLQRKASIETPLEPGAKNY